ncbi:MAG: hypothetical protein JKY31_02610 [Rhodobacteraceae bacterium]|nr:hypothetical protein [Paracoccaceae bacterium]
MSYDTIPGVDRQESALKFEHAMDSSTRMSHEYTLQEEETSSLDIGYILSAAKRRFLFFLIPFILILCASIAVAMLMKPVYQSIGTILVETQQIPTEFVQAAVTADANQRITIIKQRVMTRRNLLEIIDKFDVFPSGRSTLPVSRLVAKMHNQISIDVITANSSGGRRGIQAIAFTVGFEHQNPVIATKVANELVTLFLDENVRTRTASAAETTAFLENETQKLRDQVNELEIQIVAYKQQNRDALPEHLNLRFKMLERAEEEIRQYTRDIRSLDEEKRYLQIELTSARAGRTSANGAGSQTELQENISDLKKALLDNSTKLTDSHPDMKALRKRIDALELQQQEEDALAQKAFAENKPIVGSTYNPIVEKIQIRMSTVEQQVSDAKQQVAIAKKRVTEIEAVIIEIPQVERGLSVLNRQYSDALEKFNVLESKQAKAQLSQNLEEENKAERFILLEPPIVPTVPIRPDRARIMGIGGALAIAMGIGIAFLVEFMDRRIRTASELEVLLKHPPIVSIPYIQTQSETGKRRYKLLFILLIAIVVGVVAAIGIHFLYQPLDLLFYKAWVALDKIRLLSF